jgi:uncharacterized protein (TIGR02217 family)
MSITVFNDVIFRKCDIRSNLAGRLIRQNKRVEQISGHAQHNAMWDESLREYEFGIVPMTLVEWQTIETLHEITKGGAYGMLLEDPHDFEVTSGVVSLVSGDTYQLEKLYTHAGSARTSRRKITRPRLAGIIVNVSGVPIDGTGSPAGYDLDVDTGIITIASTPAASAVTWTGLFYVPVNFMNDAIDWTLVRAASDEDDRLFAGPSVVLKQIRE